MKTEKIEEEISSLDAKNIKVYRNKLDDLVVEMLDGSIYEKVKVMRAFPLSNPREFIILRDEEDNEIGLIERLKDLRSKSKKVLVDELQKSYFIPKITKIKDLDEKFGASQWEVETNKGTHTINVKNREDIKLLPSGRVLIKDADGNRYEIPDYRKLDSRSIALLETEM